ncbi:MAG: phage tail protein [Ilumatobacteraceae bacterium]
MAIRTHDADFQGSFFSLELDGLTIAYFTGCSGLSLEYDVTEFTQADGAKIMQTKRPGKPKYSEVVLKRGFSADKALYEWFDEVVAADKETPYKTGSIVIFDRQGQEVARFNLEQCWPSKLSVSDLSAGSDDVMVEEMTIQHEFIDWV